MRVLTPEELAQAQKLRDEIIAKADELRKLINDEETMTMITEDIRLNPHLYAEDLEEDVIMLPILALDEIEANCDEV